MNLNCTDVTAFESDRPVIFSLEEIEDGTKNFDETSKIGEGGYGVVYFGVLGEQVWQVFCWVSRYLSRHNKPFQFFFLKVKKKFFFFCIQEVAIKKMRSFMSKEFFAELKVLCKIHHINVVRNHFKITGHKCDVKEKAKHFY